MFVFNFKGKIDRIDLFKKFQAAAVVLLEVMALVLCLQEPRPVRGAETMATSLGSWQSMNTAMNAKWDTVTLSLETLLCISMLSSTW